MISTLLIPSWILTQGTEESNNLELLHELAIPLIMHLLVLCLVPDARGEAKKINYFFSI